jgi:hypothetical protein
VLREISIQRQANFAQLVMRIFLVTWLLDQLGVQLVQQVLTAQLLVRYYLLVLLVLAASSIQLLDNLSRAARLAFSVPLDLLLVQHVRQDLSAHLVGPYHHLVLFVLLEQHQMWLVLVVRVVVSRVVVDFILMCQV